MTTFIMVLLFFILTITIPRYSSTFQDIDDWMVGMISVTAFGEAIVMGLGEYAITSVRLRCGRLANQHLQEWKKHDEQMKKQEKQNWKNKELPELRGFRILDWELGLLLISALFTQLPHFVAKVRGVTITDILPSFWLWGYIGLLVFQVEIIVVGLTSAKHYAAIASDLEQEAIAKKQRQPRSDARKLELPVAELDTPAFVCKTCGYKAKSRKALNGHMKKHGNGRRVPTAEKEKVR